MPKPIGIKAQRKLLSEIAFDPKNDPVYGEMGTGLHREYFRNRALILIRDEMSSVQTPAALLKTIVTVMRHLLWYYMTHPEREYQDAADAPESR